MVSVFGSVDCLMMLLLWSSSPRQSSQNYCIRGGRVSGYAGKGLQKERLEIPENTECKPFYCCHKKKRSQLTAASPDEFFFFFLDFKTSLKEPVFSSSQLQKKLLIFTQSLYQCFRQCNKSHNMLNTKIFHLEMCIWCVFDEKQLWKNTFRVRVIVNRSV